MGQPAMSAHDGNSDAEQQSVVVVGEPEEFLAEPTLVIPFTWLGHRANAIIGLT
jgi:hypothetical protein